MRRSFRSIALAALAATAGLAFVACERSDDQETGSLGRDDVLRAREDLEPTYRQTLDSGNVAYRAGEYDEALRLFRQATRIDEDVAAGWFGVYMAALAVGDVEAADAAMERARDLAPGATLLHPDSPLHQPAGGRR